MPIIEDMLGVMDYAPPTGDPLTHGGPPDNEFSWRVTDPLVLRKALNYLVRYADVLDIHNRVMMDTAAKYIRQMYKDFDIKKSYAPMLALASLKVASYTHQHFIVVKDLVTDEDKYSTFFFEIVKKIMW